MSRRRLILLVFVAGALAFVPVAALARSGDKALLIGFELHFAGPDTTQGTFVASGAVRDSGHSTVQQLSLVPFGHKDRARLSGEQTFAGAQGEIVTRFRGIAHDVSEPHQWGEGRFEIVSGTGAYAGMKGNGRFTIVVDAAANTLIGTEQGHAG
jgi:hypothetical protein